MKLARLFVFVGWVEALYNPPLVVRSGGLRKASTHPTKTNFPRAVNCSYWKVAGYGLPGHVANVLAPKGA